MKRKNLELEMWEGVLIDDPPGCSQITVVLKEKERGITYVRVVAVIHTAPHRTEAQAIRIGRRIKANPDALDRLRGKPGIIDHRASMPKQPFFTSLTAAGKYFAKHAAKGAQS